MRPRESEEEAEEEEETGGEGKTEEARDRGRGHRERELALLHRADLDGNLCVLEAESESKQVLMGERDSEVPSQQFGETCSLP